MEKPFNLACSQPAARVNRPQQLLLLLLFLLSGCTPSSSSLAISFLASPLTAAAPAALPQTPHSPWGARPAGRVLVSCGSTALSEGPLSSISNSQGHSRPPAGSYFQTRSHSSCCSLARRLTLNPQAFFAYSLNPQRLPAAASPLALGAPCLPSRGPPVGEWAWFFCDLKGIASRLSYRGPLGGLQMRAHIHRERSRLGRPAAHRKALLRSLATQLLRHGSIITTAARAKELSRVIDSKIILAKRGGLHNYRQALGFFYDKKLTRDFFREAPQRFARREGGFCRSTRLPFPRLGDAAKVCRVELID